MWEVHLLPKLLQLLNQSNVVTCQLRYDIIPSLQPTPGLLQLTLQALHDSVWHTLPTLVGWDNRHTKLNEKDGVHVPPSTDSWVRQSLAHNQSGCISHEPSAMATY